jgi:hypothetical protein
MRRLRRALLALAREPGALVVHLWSAWIGPVPQVSLGRMSVLSRVAQPVHQRHHHDV